MRDPRLDRQQLLADFDAARAATRALFDSIDPAAYHEQPISLRHPIVFYEGHLPGFSFITLVRRALGGASFDPGLDRLFERGIDPENESAVTRFRWPDRAVVLEYAAEADRRVREALTNAELEDPANPLLERAESVYCILEHEWMHQETLRYMLHRLPLSLKRGTVPVRQVDPAPPAERFLSIPAGIATLGADRGDIAFGWDNEHPRRQLRVDAFDIAQNSVTNEAYIDFVNDRGYEREELWTAEGWEWVRSKDVRHPSFWLRDGDGWRWLGMYDFPELPRSWPVWVTHAEAEAYARWRGMRLPTEGEFHRAAYGTPSGVEREHPWGEDPPDAAHGNFGFVRDEPVPVGSLPAGTSAWGVNDLTGNGWEWTSTPFLAHDGFRAMASYPQYSEDFFDGKHFVLKGASPATARGLVRRTFRNWFRTEYPYVYAKFRLVR